VNEQLRTSTLDRSKRRYTKELGLHWRKPVSESKLTEVNIKKRLAFAIKYRTGTDGATGSFVTRRPLRRPLKEGTSRQQWRDPYSRNDHIPDKGQFLVRHQNEDEVRSLSLH
jgi:hypothetical protein